MKSSVAVAYRPATDPKSSSIPELARPLGFGKSKDLFEAARVPPNTHSRALLITARMRGAALVSRATN